MEEPVPILNGYLSDPETYPDFDDLFPVRLPNGIQGYMDAGIPGEF